MAHHELIEKMARAMCAAEGVDPDNDVELEVSEAFETPRAEDVLLTHGVGPAWKRYKRLAKLHLAAHEVLSEEPPATSTPPDGELRLELDENGSTIQ